MAYANNKAQPHKHIWRKRADSFLMRCAYKDCIAEKHEITGLVFDD